MCNCGCETPSTTVCSCGCGCTCGCNCGSSFRRFRSSEEKKAMLESYEGELQKELAGVRERITKLNA